jgi:hypothetical protein
MIDAVFNVAVFAALVLCIAGFGASAHKRVLIQPRIIDKTLCACRAAEWLRLRLGDRFVHALRTLK